MDSSIFNLERVEFDVALSTIFLTKIKYPITNVEPLFPLFHWKFRGKEEDVGTETEGGKKRTIIPFNPRTAAVT